MPFQVVTVLRGAFEVAVTFLSATAVTLSFCGEWCDEQGH